jgi:uncharacterized protein (DUF3820 family)
LVKNKDIIKFRFTILTIFEPLLGPNPEILKQIVTTKMPFGRFSGRLLCDLPVSYLEWFKRKGGFPPSKLGQQLDTVYEIKLNGLEDIIFELKKRYATRF